MPDTSSPAVCESIRNTILLLNACWLTSMASDAMSDKTGYLAYIAIVRTKAISLDLWDVCHAFDLGPDQYLAHINKLKRRTLSAFQASIGSAGVPMITRNKDGTFAVSRPDPRPSARFSQQQGSPDESPSMYSRAASGRDIGDSDDDSDNDGDQ